MNAEEDVQGHVLVGVVFVGILIIEGYAIAIVSCVGLSSRVRRLSVVEENGGVLGIAEAQDVAMAILVTEIGSIDRLIGVSVPTSHCLVTSLDTMELMGRLLEVVERILEGRNNTQTVVGVLRTVSLNAISIDVKEN